MSTGASGPALDAGEEPMLEENNSDAEDDELLLEDNCACAEALNSNHDRRRHMPGEHDDDDDDGLTLEENAPFEGEADDEGPTLEENAADLPTLEDNAAASSGHGLLGFSASPSVVLNQCVQQPVAEAPGVGAPSGKRKKSRAIKRSKAPTADGAGVVQSKARAGPYATGRTGGAC